MAVRPTVTDTDSFGTELMSASPDLLGSMVKAFAEALMGAEVDGIRNAEYGEISPGRMNRRNGYRAREWDTRAGTIDLAVPKPRQGSCFPEWLLTRRRRVEQALISMVATSYPLGVSTRLVDKLVEQLGVARISTSQVSVLAMHSTLRSRRSAPGRWTPARTGSSRPTRTRSACGRETRYGRLPMRLSAPGWSGLSPDHPR